MKPSISPRVPTPILTIAGALLIALLLLTMTNLAGAVPAGTRRCFVKVNAAGSDDGSSWRDAYPGLHGVQTALNDSTCTEIWVAKGTYLPGTERTATFRLKNGVKLYGGFGGKEVKLADRDALANETILSGNVGDIATHADNSYHVVTGSGADITALLDGFVIANGRATGLGSNENKGAGIYIANGSPSIRNVTIRDNFASGSGGGMYNNGNSQSEFYNLTFANNEALYGGAMYNGMSNLRLLNATLVNNTAGAGGAIYNAYSNPAFSNVTISANSASDNGGGLANEFSDPKVANAILWANTAGGDGQQIYDDGDSNASVSYSVVEGGFPAGGHIISDDPRLGSLGSHGGHTSVMPLQFSSPAIDAGDDNNCSLADQRQLPRAGQGAACDIGAFEFQPVLYASPTGRTSAQCHSWSFACALQYALSQADRGQEIWVKAGTYKPSAISDRAASFEMKGVVDLYGGFAGTEKARQQRDWIANETILSGDLGLQGDHSDNSYHVVRMRGSFIGDGWETILDGFTIAHGNANLGPDDNQGGGLYLDGANPIIRNVIFSNNAAFYGGGAAADSYSQPAIQGVTFISNTASLGAGFYSQDSSPRLLKVNFEANAASGDGGGMYGTASNADLSEVFFTGNSADNHGGGLSIGAKSSGDWSNVVFSSNQAGQFGGGLYIFANSEPKLSNVSFDQNEAEKGGGVAIGLANPQLTGAEFLDNVASSAGGGLYLLSSDATVTDALLSRNRAGAGGGIYSYGGSPQISQATFSFNETFYSPGNSLVANGGGMFIESGETPKLSHVSFLDNEANSNGGGLAIIKGGIPGLEKVTFSANRANYGGGMYNVDTDPLMTNVTFAGNSAFSGGGLYARDSHYLKLTHGTLSGNRALGIGDLEPGRGGGIWIQDSELPLIRNTIFWDNTALSSGDQIYNRPAHAGWGTQALKSSVVQGGCPAEITCTGIIIDDPQLGPLGDYGGQIQTMPLGATSSALDEAEGTFADCPATDQRGVSRPQGNYCDIGAFEARFYELTVDTSGSGSGVVSGPGLHCSSSCVKNYPEQAEITLTATPEPGSVFSGWLGACSGAGECALAMNGDAAVTAAFDPLPPDSFALTVYLDGDGAGAVTGSGINCFDGPGADCSELYASGAEVTLLASAEAGSLFGGWTGACSHLSGPCVITVTESTSVTATFSRAGYTVFVPAVISKP